MTEEETLQIDPSELSDEVLEDLVDEAEISPEEAEKFANRVQLEEIETTDPVRKNVFESTVIKSNSVYERLSNWYNTWKAKTTNVEITDVEADENNRITIKFNHPGIYRDTMRFNSDSVELANLMAYHGIDNPMELESEKIALKNISDTTDSSRRVGIHSHSEAELAVPNNVSILGKLRYKAFATIQNARSMTKYWMDSDPVEGTFFGFLGYAFVFCISLLIGGLGADITKSTSNPIVDAIGHLLIIPFTLLLVFGIGVLFYGMMRLFLYIAYRLVRGDFHTV